MPFNRPVLIPSAIEPNPETPRKHFDEAALNELASNMKEIGQLHPCIVTVLREDQYQSSRVSAAGEPPSEPACLKCGVSSAQV
jgi:hypothetical protein